jgi:phosphohistidine phosphatase SixA
MKKILAPLLALALGALFLTSALARRDAAAAAPAAQRTVILVRHAEKDTDDPRDPTLSPAGRERARRLAALLAESGADRLVATEFKRTQQTLEPLAEALGLEIEVVPARDLTAVSTLVREAPPGETLVIAGHSNTVPVLAARFGVPLSGLVPQGQGEGLPESQYDRLLVFTLPPEDGGAQPSLLELRY